MPSASRIIKNPRQVRADAPSGPGYLEELRALSTRVGLDALGVAPAAPLLRARAEMARRQAEGLTNGLTFTYLKPERSTDPSALLPDARTVIVAARSCDIAPNDAPHADGPRAVVARYAWIDHYGELKKSLNQVAARLRADGNKAVVFADDNSVVDREVAWLAGIGWYGKNANILVPGAGSFFVLGCIVTTADLPVAEPVADGCGTCSRCMPACPTDAIPEPGVIDANRCLSWLLQKPGVFPREHRVALGARIYGCDDCQTACPFTRRKDARSNGAVTESSIGVLELLSASDEQIMERCDRWYVHQREAVWVRRNLMIVLGNTADAGDPRVVAAVRAGITHGHAAVRAHAVWAAARLGLTSLIPATDSDPVVAEELANLPALREPL